MSIDNGVTSNAPKAVAQAAGGHGQGRAQASTAPGGFAALLMGLDGEGLAKAADATEGKLKASKDTTLPAVSADAAVAAAGLPAPVPPADPQALKSASGEPPAGRVRAMPPQAALQTGEEGVTQTRQQDAVAAQEAVEATNSSTRFQTLLRQAAINQRMTQNDAQADEATARTVKDHRDGDAVTRMLGPASESLQPAGNPAHVLLAAGGGEWDLRPAERRTEKSSQRESGVGELGALVGQSSSDTVRPDAVPAAAPDSGLMTETRVAEQVSYWVSHGVQKAELKVDGLGEGPVKVNIQLQGVEARVEFSADQVQTRQVLEDSMPHLRELLAREGLVLTGVSVGSSGADGAAGRQSQGREGGGRQAMVAVPELQAAVGVAPRALPTGRSVDLFV